MKPSVILGAVALSLPCACSANSDADNGSNGAGASSSMGSMSNTGSGAVPSLGIAGSVMLGEVPGIAGGAVVANGECAQQNFIVKSKPADVLLVLDRSKSMIEHTVPPMGLTRWDAVKPALTAVISATDSSVSWGLKLFPEGEGAACVATGVTDAIPAPIARGNAVTVNGIINSTMALGNGTPTGDAIYAAAAYLTSRNTSNQYIVLATDGDPSCPSGSAGETQAIMALAAAKAAGFPTYVIGVLDPVEDESKFTVLNSMAEAGGTSRSDNPAGDNFYQAYSESELTAALLAVTGEVASCLFEFDEPPPDATNIAVKVNGMLITRDTSKAGGWDYTSDQYLSLELHGDACQQVKDATDDDHVDIIFGCKGVPIK